YDKRGNVIETYKNDSLRNRYVFGALNRLEEAFDVQGNVGATYKYNGLGHRIGKTEGISPKPILPTVNLENSVLNPSKQVDDVLDMTKQHHNLLQRKEEGQITTFAWDTNVLSARRSDKQVYTYLQDDLGSPIRLFGEQEDMRDVFGYDEFGNRFTNVEEKVSFNQPFTYTGYQADSISNSYYAQLREYKPQVGRFVSEDPIRAGENWYSYCINNPLLFIDPLGLDIEDVDGFGFTEALRFINYLKYAADTGIPFVQLGVESRMLANLNPLSDLSRVGDLRKIMGRLGNVVSVGMLFVNVGYGIHENVQAGTDRSRIVSDAGVDTVTGIAVIGVGVIAKVAFGSVIGGVAGAVMGVIVSIILSRPNSSGDQTIGEDVKDAVYDGMEEIGRQEREIGYHRGRWTIPMRWL
ncbi:MAG: RHS repeat-associated core domain-containing protein, partial [Lachnospiraceae bacterium]|nr:RHS repeat-associated core domain-containing protein [Lachnospiraceae bacterium]